MKTPEHLLFSAGTWVCPSPPQIPVRVASQESGPKFWRRCPGQESFERRHQVVVRGRVERHPAASASDGRRSLHHLRHVRVERDLVVAASLARFVSSYLNKTLDEWMKGLSIRMTQIMRSSTHAFLKMGLSRPRSGFFPFLGTLLGYNW